MRIASSEEISGLRVRRSNDILSGDDTLALYLSTIVDISETGFVAALVVSSSVCVAVVEVIVVMERETVDLGGYVRVV